MYDLVCGKRFAKGISYRSLLSHLHRIEFRWSIPKDESRAGDGLDLRSRFAYDLLDDPINELGDECTVLEMMVALAIRCEECIMDDPLMGDRTGQWFWGMINNLGLGAMTDDRYDEEAVDEIIDTFLDREYAPNGKGGLFKIRGCKDDLRDVEIWYQLCWYLDSIS